MTFKPLIFENFRGPEVVGSSSYQKNIGAEITHYFIVLEDRCESLITTLATLILVSGFCLLLEKYLHL